MFPPFPVVPFHLSSLLIFLSFLKSFWHTWLDACAFLFLVLSWMKNRYFMKKFFKSNPIRREMTKSQFFRNSKWIHKRWRTASELLNLLSMFSIHKQSGPDYEYLKHLTLNLCVSTKWQQALWLPFWSIKLLNCFWSKNVHKLKN